MPNYAISSVREFLSLSEEVFPHITLLYFRRKDFVMFTPEQESKFFENIAKCSNLQRVNLNGSSLSDAQVDRIDTVLSQITSLQTFNARHVVNSLEHELGASIFSKLYAKSIRIIDNDTEAYQPDGDWVFEEEEPLQEWYDRYLLIQSAAHRNFEVSKFSRKSPDYVLPVSALVSDDLEIFLTPKCKSVPPDILDYHQSLRELSRNHWIELGLNFTTNPVQPKLFLIKMRMDNPLSTYNEMRHISIIAGKTSSFVSRSFKKYIIFEADAGEDGSSVIMKSREISLEQIHATAIRRSIAVIIAVLTQLHARGKVHLDIKPNNMIFCSDSLVKIIDFGAVHTPDSIDSFIPILRDRALGTTFFAPPEGLIARNGFFSYGLYTDAWSVGKCIQLLLYPRTMKLDKPLNDGTSEVSVARWDEPFAPQLQQHFTSGIAKEYGEDVTTAVNKLLIVGFLKRGSILELFEFFYKKYPELASDVIEVNIAATIKDIAKITSGNMFLNNWLQAYLTTHNIKDLQSIGPLDYTALLKLQLIARYLQLLHQKRAWTLPMILEECNNELDKLLLIDKLNIITANRFHNKINTMDDTVAAYHELLTLEILDFCKSLRPSVLFIPSYQPLEDLLTLQRQIHELQHQQAPIAEILRFAYINILRITAGVSDGLIKQQFETLAKKFQTTLETAGIAITTTTPLWSTARPLLKRKEASGPRTKDYREPLAKRARSLR